MYNRGKEEPNDQSNPFCQSIPRVCNHRRLRALDRHPDSHGGAYCNRAGSDRATYFGGSDVHAPAANHGTNCRLAT